MTPDSRFIVKPFHTEAAVYDRHSGDTHYLPPLSHAILRISLEHPGLSREEIRGRLAALYDVGPEFMPLARIDEALEGLRKIGLLAPG